MQRMVIAAAMSLCVASVTTISADTLIMKDGTRVSGRVVSVAARTMTFEDASGVSRRYNANQVDALEDVRVPAETLLTFTLNKPASLQAER